VLHFVEIAVKHVHLAALDGEKCAAVHEVRPLMGLDDRPREAERPQ
jgi:hypothetical protein